MWVYSENYLLILVRVIETLFGKMKSSVVFEIVEKYGRILMLQLITNKFLCYHMDELMRILEI